MSNFYDRVAAASGINREIVKKVLTAAAYTPSDSERPKLESVGVTKCPCGQRGCTDYHLTGVGSFSQGAGFKKTEAQEIARRINNHYSLVRALSTFVLLGSGSKVMISRLVNENGRIALASVGET